MAKTVARISRGAGVTLHLVFNLIIAGIAIFGPAAFGTPIVGFVAVLLLKWRTFVVRPRFWLVNLMGALVDIMAGVGFVYLSYALGEIQILHFVLLAAYLLWLLVLKTRVSENAMLVQALIALFLFGATIMLGLTGGWLVLGVVAAFLAGLAAARHILSASDDHNYEVVLPMCGLMTATIYLISTQFLIVYDFGGLLLPQGAFLMATGLWLWVVAYRHITRHDGKIAWSLESALPILLPLVVFLILIIAFSAPLYAF